MRVLTLGWCLLVGCTVGPAESAATTASTGQESDSATGSSGSSGATEGTACGGGGATLGVQLFECAFDPELSDWEWLRFEPTGVRITSGVLEIAMRSGTLWEDANDVENVALRPVAGGDFTVTVEVTGEVVDGGEQAGLLWYGDDDNYVKVVKERVISQRNIVLVHELAGVPSVDAIVPIDTDEVMLRLRLSGGTMTAEYRSGDAGSWTEVGVTDFDPALGSQIGLFAQGTDDTRWTTFTQFSVSTP